MIPYRTPYCADTVRYGNRTGPPQDSTFLRFFRHCPPRIWAWISKDRIRLALAYLPQGHAETG